MQHSPHVAQRPQYSLVHFAILPVKMPPEQGIFLESLSADWIRWMARFEHYQREIDSLLKEKLHF